ncbi:hypothetical protein V6N11_050673 [Hibiscus sabdariffa]|uniref:Uncharacterized protein n=1 Tax=Hibiscus sabdariffa TaxID=183260 RepID=A0ABR2TAJ9_9ROSI
MQADLSSTGRTRPPRGGEVDPTAPFHASISALLPQLKPFTLRRDQATSRWQGPPSTVEVGLLLKFFWNQPLYANIYFQLAYWANFAGFSAWLTKLDMAFPTAVHAKTINLR